MVEGEGIEEGGSSSPQNQESTVNWVRPVRSGVNVTNASVEQIQRMAEKGVRLDITESGPGGVRANVVQEVVTGMPSTPDRRPWYRKAFDRLTGKG